MSFTVDTTKPALSVLVNDRKDFGAYNGSVLPVISYNDVNFDSDQVEISMTGVRVTVAKTVINEDEVVFPRDISIFNIGVQCMIFHQLFIHIQIKINMYDVGI